MTPKQKAILDAVKKRREEEEIGPGVGALRQAEFASQGAVDSFLNAVGNIPDAVSFALRNIPGVPETLGKVGVGIPEEGYYKDTLKKGFYDVGRAISKPLNDAVNFGPSKPVTSGERMAYGAGRGVGDATSFMLPGAALGKLAKAGSTTANIGKTVASQPIMQSAAGAVGGATAEATNSDATGLAASLATPVVAALGRRLVSPVPRQLSPQETRLAQKAQDMGVELTPGQMTGSRPLQTAESQLTQLPLSSRPQTEIYDAQRKAFNKEVLKRTGINADEASPEIIEGAFAKLSQQFDDLINRTELNMDHQFFDDVNKVVMDQGRRLKADVKGQFRSYIDDISQMAKAAQLPTNSDQSLVLLSAPQQRVLIEGNTYAKISSDLRKAIRNSRNDPNTQQAYVSLSKALDDQMARSVPDDVAAKWKNTRRKYSNLLVVDDAMTKGGGADAVSGDIPFGAFKSAVVRDNPRQYGRGGGELNDVARVGQFLANKIPNSGTTERSTMERLLTGGSVVGGGGAAFADPTYIAPAMAAPFVIPPMVQKAINSPIGRAYLTNQLMGAPRYPMSQTLGKIYSAQQGE